MATFSAAVKSGSNWCRCHKNPTHDSGIPPAPRHHLFQWLSLRSILYRSLACLAQPADAAECFCPLPMVQQSPPSPLAANQIAFTRIGRLFSPLPLSFFRSRVSSTMPAVPKLLSALPLTYFASCIILMIRARLRTALPLTLVRCSRAIFVPPEAPTRCGPGYPKCFLFSASSLPAEKRAFWGHPETSIIFCLQHLNVGISRTRDLRAVPGHTRLPFPY